MIMNALEIKQKRKKLGLTQEELAKKLGVSLKTISNYEKGEVIPESKKELLHKILNSESNNTLNEPEENYTIQDEFEEKISQVKEKISEHNQIIELAISNNDQNLKVHHEEIVKLLIKQIDLIKTAKKNYYLDK